MSIFNELLPKLFDVSNLCTENLNGLLKDALKSIEKFDEDFQSQYGRKKAREKAQRDKNAMITLQSIDEGEDEQNKISDPEPAKRTSKSRSNSQSSNDKQLGPKKRSKHEVDDMSSPEQDKRVKRNASVKAQSIISKQVNVNLTQKLRREKSMDKSEPVRQSSRSRRHKDDKENLAPEETLTIQIKHEKLSLPEPMETEVVNMLTDVQIKQERHKDDIAMPPPAIPVPKPRKGVPKEKSQDKPLEETSEEDPSRRSRRGTRNKKLTDAAPAPAPRLTRSFARGRDTEEPPAAEPAPEPRPKRTRGRKKLSQIRADSGNVTQSSTESLPASPADKPRPKRTRRAQKPDKEEPKPVETELAISPKEERPSQEPQEQISSPIIKPKNKKEKTTKELVKTNSTDKLTTQNIDKDLTATKITTDPKSKNIGTELTSTLDQESVKSKSDKDLVKTKNGLVNTVEKLVASVDQVDIAFDETRIISKVSEMDQTVILPNGVYNHAPVTPKNTHMNETVVLEHSNIPDKLNGVMDATVVLDKGPLPPNITDDNSLITDDSDSEADISNTPPKKGIPDVQPLSAVKEKVQQFEELATRVTRTKTRAMAKKEEDKDTETQTPPDKISKAILSSDTLSKMNSLIFNGKPPQTTSSACKPRSAVPVRPGPASASKAAAISRAREADETLRREDARQKKEALLEAKREQQKRKREEKMAAAAAARSAAERERRALLEAAARERGERQLQAELERGRALREAEKKKQELARKAAETEERRRAEETARQQRLAEEQRRAIELRIKKNEESEAMRREEARMAKEIERKQREYHEKQKKQKIDKMHTPFKTPLAKYPPLPPAYMEDGFQYLNSDEDADPPERPVPAWSTSKARRARLCSQQLVARRLVSLWFRECARSPDLAEIFPGIERARLKRTSSAVWRTPPRDRDRDRD